MNRFCIAPDVQNKPCIINGEGYVILLVKVQMYGAATKKTINPTILGIKLKTINEVKEVFNSRGYETDEENLFKAIKDLTSAEDMERTRVLYSSIDNTKTYPDWSSIKTYLKE